MRAAGILFIGSVVIMCCGVADTFAGWWAAEKGL